jgi:hypothetical protein
VKFFDPVKLLRAEVAELTGGDRMIDSLPLVIVYFRLK